MPSLRYQTEKYVIKIISLILAVTFIILVAAGLYYLVEVA